MIGDEGLHPLQRQPGFGVSANMLLTHIAHKSRKKELVLSCLNLKSHFLPSRFLSGSRAWKFCERFGS